MRDSTIRALGLTLSALYRRRLCSASPPAPTLAQSPAGSLPASAHTESINRPSVASRSSAAINSWPRGPR
jgi:hypothetical protein